MNLIGTRMHFAGAGFNQLTNIVRRRSAAARQLPNFSCHHGKTFPLIARSRGFDRSVERQDIGLEGDIINQRGDGANALRAVGNFIHRSDDALHRLPALLGRATGGN